MEQVYKEQEEKLMQELNKKLISKNTELKFELSATKIKFDSVNQDLSEFKYKYNEQQQIINGSE